MANLAYFEVPVEDLERAKKFYQEVLGWKIEKSKMPESPPDYCDISTGKSKKNTLNSGGMYKRTKEMPPNLMIVSYAQVDSIDKALAAAQKLGGTITMPKMAIKQVGFVAQVKDTEGNVIGIWEMEKK
ncbi:MAG: VOC family protein [Candidatus Micrarchaeota archaeon]